MNKLLYYSSMGVLAMAFFLMTYLTFLTVAPHTYWFEYESVTVTDETVPLDGNLNMISLSEVSRDVILNFNDILECRFNGSENFTNYIQDTADAVATKRELGERPWVFNVYQPLPEPATCRVKAQITAELPFGVKKTQVITSNEVRFENE